MNNKEILDLAIDKMYEQIAKVEIERAMEKTRIMMQTTAGRSKKLSACTPKKKNSNIITPAHRFS